MSNDDHPRWWVWNRERVVLTAFGLFAEFLGLGLGYLLWGRR